MSEFLKLIECPRDAMQGWDKFIPTEKKIEYHNSLLKVGFDVLDFGSFVSHKAVPQMADTKDVIRNLNLDNVITKLLAIVANVRGAAEAVAYDQISYLGYPFSISETFQFRNTNKSIEESFPVVDEIHNLCEQHNKKLVVYISMGFGNPYGDDYNPEIAIKVFKKLAGLGITTINMADTIGVANPPLITNIFERLLAEVKDVNIGAHFHSTNDRWEEKISAAYNAGSRAFDSAMLGIGGCPMAMANDELVGNIATENIVSWCGQNNIPLQIDMEAFYNSRKIAQEIFK